MLAHTAALSCPQEQSRHLSSAADQRVISHAIAQEHNIQARHAARRVEQRETADHNLQAIRAKEASKAAERQASLAQDREHNANCCRTGLPKLAPLASRPAPPAVQQATCLLHAAHMHLAVPI